MREAIYYQGLKRPKLNATALRIRTIYGSYSSVVDKQTQRRDVYDRVDNLLKVVNPMEGALVAPSAGSHESQHPPGSPLYSH
jgi:hypothetical protein